MIKGRKKYLLVIIVPLFLVLAPVFFQSVQMPNGIQQYPNLESEAYCWVTTRNSFVYFLVGGAASITLREDTYFAMLNEDKSLNSLHISHAVAVIDGTEHQLSSIVNKDYRFDTSMHNMYGGQRGNCMISFDLPKVPKNGLHITIRGEVLSRTEDHYPFEYDQEITAEKRVSIYPMFIYVLGQWTST